MFPYFLLLFLPSTCVPFAVLSVWFLGGGLIDFGLPSFPVYVFKALSYHLNTVRWVPQVWISQIFLIFHVKVFSNLHCVFKNHYSWNSTRSMSSIFPMFGEVFLVAPFGSLLIPWGAPSWFWGYCYKYHRPADKQQKVASYSTGGWEVARSPAGAMSGEACFLVPRLPASSPCPGSMGAH